MYPEEFLKQEGFERRKCKVCGKNFWSATERDICDDCEASYYFLDKKIAKAEMNYIEAWKKFAKFMEKFGYTVIPRYPVIPRWRDDVFFVQASIYDFQPHVVSGEVPPPANPLIVPQFSIRFTDIENVGVTGRHYTGFVMIGRHHFEREKYDPNELFEPIFRWLTEGMKIPKENLIFIEDWWEGGGNAGPCIESWSGGLELLNTVFMLYKTTESGLKELEIKVLDEGSGQERWAWFTSNEPVSYLVVFPNSIKYLEESTGIKVDKDLLRKMIKYVKNFDVRKKDFSWLSKMTGIGEEELEYEILLYRDLFSIPDHVRTLLFAIKDGAIPSNTGQGYYLRILFRRIFEIMRKRDWNFDIHKIFELEMRFLREEFPDIVDPAVLEIIKEIIEVEMKKWKKSREKALRIIRKIRKVDEKKLREFYESHGITPEMLEEFGVEIPENAYLILMKEKHEKKKRIVEDIPEIPTKMLFYEFPDLYETEARVLKIIGNKVILNQTIFYPESGGQKYDTGYINDARVLEVYKVGKTIVHVVDKVTFREGDIVRLRIDEKRRKRLMRHHTATHVLIQAARRILGPHVWQQGAEKDEEIARLDISHFKDLTIDDIQEIERLANQIVFEGRKVNIKIMDRNEAERKYGFIIYQGGVVPGKEIRIVEIEGFDVQACAGLHVSNTREIGFIKIVKVQKVKDGVYRFWFRAWDQAIDEILKRDRMILELSKEWQISPEEVKDRAMRFFEEWKEYMKKAKKLEEWILEKITKAFEEVDFVEGTEEIELGKYVALMKDLEKKGVRDKALKVGNKIIVLGDPNKFLDLIKDKKLEKEIGEVRIYS